MDLLTFYRLAIGTLAIGAGMTFWEHRSNPKRSKSLRILAGGFAMLAIGCTVVLFRGVVSAPIGSAIANLLVLSGYLLILGGVASLSGRRYRAVPACVLGGMLVVWATAGLMWHDAVWAYVSSVPIALVSALTAWEMIRCQAMKSLAARHIVVGASVIHALFYAFRATILPWWAAASGPEILAAASKVTIYEGVLYSVILPMALLKLIRDESHGQLLRESQTDYLTRLGNRRWFFEEGERVIGKSRGPVAVLAFDLDHFKAVNDLHGHETGDRVLKSFADIAQNELGPNVLLARIGGEEFAALLSGAEARRAQELGETVAQRFAKTISNRAASIGVPATVSIGLAQYESDVPALAEGLSAADRALYRAKALGGNRLELAQPAAPADQAISA